ncbi:NAD(P)/FAD-dependent oxidoreductase [Candidatus Sumerlaeota bacterium]|nr:NAD(P)/FAD-dependent oxidoreductase [Candidatus Sumerlaeota bacterium]
MKKIETKYLILGNSTAAISCVESIRSLDKEGSVSMVAAEKERAYSKPLISYLLCGSITPKQMYYRPRDFYENNRINALLGSEAMKIDAAHYMVTTATGEEITFERLLIATGGRPILPDIPGIRSEGVFTFFTWKDAENVRKFIQRRKVNHAVVVGGGLIGVKTLEALLKLGVKTDVVEKAPRILATILDDEAGRIVDKRLADDGVEIHCGTTVSKILAVDDLTYGVRLDNNREIECEMVVFAIGVRPDTRLAEEAGIKTGKGIIVSNRMETSFPGIYAAGDVTQSYDLTTGVARNIALFPSAYRQGKVAGINMAGGNMEYPGGIVMNSVSVCGLPIISVGDIQGEGMDTEIYSRLDEKSSIYKKVLVKNDRITGVLFVNQVDRVGIYTGMIKSGINVSEIRDMLLTEEFGVLTLPKEYRKYVISGVGIEI